MAMAKVYPPAFNIFEPPRMIPGGWVEQFPVYFHGTDVPTGFAFDSLEVEFLDADGPFIMDNKIRDAARVKATARGLVVGIAGVISFAPPRRL